MKNMCQNLSGYYCFEKNATSSIFQTGNRVELSERACRFMLNDILVLIWPQGYQTFFMLNSAEHGIFSANKYENANNSWHFHIY